MYDRLDDFGAASARAGVDSWSLSLNLMSWGQNQVVHMTRPWLRQAQLSADQAASQDGWAEIPL